MSIVTLRGTLATGGAGRKPRQLPGKLLLTDPRHLADPIPVIARLPPGSGVVFRHYELPPDQREAMARAVAVLCRRRRLVLFVAGDNRLAGAVGAPGVHLPEELVIQRAGAVRRGGRLLTAAAHNSGAVHRAARCGGDAVLISPVFATASHPGAAPLGPVRFAALATLARRLGLGVYALGGIDGATARRIRHVPKTGTAAIRGMAAV